MLQEIEYAAVWWASQLCPSKPLTEDQLQIFTVALQDELLNKYKNHWYADWPMRGQAYRAIHCNFPKGLVDEVLQKAAKQASIENCLDCFAQMDEHIQMWVDPGEVEVSYVHTHRTELIYQQQKSYRTTTSPRSTSPVHSSSRSRSPVQPASPPSMMYYYTPQQQQQHFAFQDNVFMYSQQQQPSTLAQREAWSPAGQSTLYRTGMQHV